MVVSMHCGQSSIPRNAATSLTTPDFRWLHAEVWSEQQSLTFLRFRQDGAALRLTGGVPFETGKRRTAPRVFGRWLLEQEPGPSLAAVEAQVFDRVFRTVHLVVSAPAPPLTWSDEWARSALSLIISGVVLMTRADLVLVIPIGRGTSESLIATGWGSAKVVWTPLDPLALSFGSGARVQLLTLDPHAWWEDAHGAKDRLTLSYLEKRMHAEGRNEPSCHAKAKRRRRGLFGWSS